MANSFSAGFFITIAFIHIIPEQLEKYNDMKIKEFEAEEAA